MSLDRAIGANNTLLWHLPSDLKRFKRLTTGHTILMGRKTWESLPNGALPNRRNVVVSRRASMLEGAEVYPNIEEALSALSTEERLFVIGGGEIYTQLLPKATKLCLTLVEGTFPAADTFFPKLDWSEWQRTTEEYTPAQEEGGFGSTYIEATRRQ